MNTIMHFFFQHLNTFKSGSVYTLEIKIKNERV